MRNTPFVEVNERGNEIVLEIATHPFAGTKYKRSQKMWKKPAGDTNYII